MRKLAHIEPARKPAYQVARQILGEDLILPSEIARRQNLPYARRVLAVCDRNLPSEEDLVWCRDNNMFLLPGPPKTMSFLDIRVANANFFLQGRFPGYDKDWYEAMTERFTKTNKVKALDWIAILKGAVVGSFSKKWSEQEKLVTEPMLVPNVAETVWALTTYKVVRHMWPSNVCVLTRSVDSVGRRVCVGISDVGNLDVSNVWDSALPDIGISAVRQF